MKSNFSASLVLMSTERCRPLNGFQVKILLLPRGEVWSHDSHFQPSGHNTREHTAESIEPTLISGWHHFGDVHHEGSFRVAVLNTCADHNKTVRQFKCSKQQSKRMKMNASYPWQLHHLRVLRKAARNGTSGPWRERVGGWWSSEAELLRRAASDASQPSAAACLPYPCPRCPAWCPASRPAWRFPPSWSSWWHRTPGDWGSEVWLPVYQKEICNTI